MRVSKWLFAVLLGLSAYSAWVAWSRPPVTITVDVPNFPQGMWEPQPPMTYRELSAKLGVFPENLKPEQRAEWEQLRLKYEASLSEINPEQKNQ